MTYRRVKRPRAVRWGLQRYVERHARRAFGGTRTYTPPCRSAMSCACAHPTARLGRGSLPGFSSPPGLCRDDADTSAIRMGKVRPRVRTCSLPFDDVGSSYLPHKKRCQHTLLVPSRSLPLRLFERLQCEYTVVLPHVVIHLISGPIAETSSLPVAPSLWNVA